MKVTVQKEQRSPVPATEKAIQRHEYTAPEVDIFETDEQYLLEAEMPGVSKDGLEISQEGTELTILGHRHTETPDGTLLVRESSLLDYRRVFELDPAIDSARISAKMEQGVLTLVLPKSEQVKPRKIKVD